MIRAEGQITIDRSAREVLEFVLDLDRYRQADAKIVKVNDQPTVDEDQPAGRARYRGALRGIRTPPQWQIVTLTPWSAVRLHTAPNQWTARFARFEGGFECVPADGGGTRLTHYEQFDFRALAPAADRFLRTWLQRYIDDEEMPRLKSLIETAPASRT
jgi:hypothetical protein